MSIWLTRAAESSWISLGQTTDSSRLDRRSRGSHHRLLPVFMHSYADEQSHTQGGLEDDEMQDTEGTRPRNDHSS